MKLISWNVHGMNSASKRAEIKMSNLFSKGCLFFTKMEDIDSHVIRYICRFHDPCFVFLPSNGSSGGTLLLWNSMLWQLLDVYVGLFLLEMIKKILSGQQLLFMALIYHQIGMLSGWS